VTSKDGFKSTERESAEEADGRPERASDFLDVDLLHGLASAAAAELRLLRFHALRHGAGSPPARSDARWGQGFLGHSELTSTERYLHAKARPEDVVRLNRALAVATPDDSVLA
jgi:integrase